MFMFVFTAMPKTPLKHVMATTMTVIVCALSFHAAVDRAAIAAAATMNGVERGARVAAVVRPPNDHNIVWWCPAYRHPVHGRT